MSLHRATLLCVTLQAATALKVTVAGASGFVGSRVCKYLVEAGGHEVRGVSKSGTAPEWAVGEPWVTSVTWVANDFTRGSLERLSEAIGTPDAYVSCVGSIGFDRQGLLLGNGKANVDAAKALKPAGTVQRVSYVSVSEDLFSCSSWLPGFFVGYFDGKRQAEAAFEELAPGGVTVVRPTFIYGGDSFGIAPPRVTSEYGAFIEGLLSAPPFVVLANVLPGLLKVALRPPVSGDAVAAACARAVLGKLEPSESVLDGAKVINAAADLPEPPATE